MYDLISVGNISIDLYFKSKSLTFKNNRFQLAVGGKYTADYFAESVGGGGANVAIGAAKHGLKTAVFGIIGENPFKRIILDKLREQKVSTDLYFPEKNFINISCLLLTETGERTIIHYPTPHVHLKGYRKLIDTKAVYFGNMQDVPLDEKVEAVNLLSSKKKLIILNLGVKDCRKSIASLKHFINKADILIINGHEFAELVKAPYEDIHFKENVVKWYSDWLSKKIVIITEGKNGSYGYFNDKIIHQIAVTPKKIIDSTGAGDGYASGFISEYLCSRNVERAMEKGAKYAAKIIAKVGAN